MTSIASCSIAPELVSLSEAPDAPDIGTKWKKYEQFNWDRIEMISVDDKFIGPLHWGGAVKMEPGQHLITVKMSVQPRIGHWSLRGASRVATGAATRPTLRAERFR